MFKFDSDYDFDFFAGGFSLLVEGDAFVWQPVPSGHTLVGAICTWQETCPNVAVEIWQLDKAKNPVVYYESFARHDVEVKITWKGEKGKIWHVEYIDDEQDGPACEVESIPTPPTEKDLILKDDAKMIGCERLSNL
jgi:hypothetical protein